MVGLSVDRRVLNLITKQKRDLKALTDREARALLIAWARAWDEISAALDEAIEELLGAATGGTGVVQRRITVRQAAKALDEASAMLEALIVTTGVKASADLLAIVRQGSRNAEALTRAQLPKQAEATMRLLRTDSRQIAEIVNRTSQRITSRHVWLSADAQEALRRELVRSVTVGDNPKVAARRMRQRVNGVFNGGRNRALTIARTEQLDAYRRAAKVSDQLNKTVLEGWRWIAELGERTCRSCVAMHGREFPVNVDGPDDHPNGRCARVPITKSWADLGFPELDEPADLTPDAEEWFKGQPEEVQRKILTNRGYDEWKAGRYPMEQWTHQRQNEGWRSSRQPTVPPQSDRDGS